MKTGSKVRVLVVDDSALMRQMLSAMLAEDPEIEVVGSAPDPHYAREKIKALNPDVVTLDVEMPRMDGLSFLEKIMTLRPMPVVMISSLTQKGADATLQALELGAVDFVAKPQSDLENRLSSKQGEICEKVKAAARARVTAREATDYSKERAARPRTGYSSTERIVAIGASTGGVEALREVICRMPADSPAIIMTQHMPEKFTRSFADRLNGLAAMTVKEAADGDRVMPGHAYLAPGDRHLELVRSGADYRCRLTDAPPVSGHRPSVDVLFRSVAKSAGKNAIGVILTGMGKDGADGLLELRDAGGLTLGQDEASCVVYGMPKVAFERGAVMKQLPLSKIADGILDLCGDAKTRLIRV
jgi:two-component system chemotaxis response regulator CheB